MRISSAQIYRAGVLGIDSNQSALYKLQNQISSNRRILTPEDDPVGAAQALVLTQTQSINKQQIANQGSANDQLSLVGSQLSSLTDLLQSVRVEVVQAGSTATLSNADRQTLADSLQSSLNEMTGIANAKDATGDYMFSGYQGATMPFAINGSAAIVAPATTAPIAYSGDGGQRSLQVSAGRQMAVNVAGDDLFMNVKQGNGTFVSASGVNTGTATVDAGSVLNPQTWAAAANNPAAGQPLQIRFSAPGGVMSYGIYDPVSGTTTGPLPYTSGQAIPLKTAGTGGGPVDFGSQVVISGQPAAGDSFTITPSSNQSLFQTMQNLIGILRTPLNSASATTQFTNALAGQLTNLDGALANVSRVQSSVGSRLNELDALGSTASDLDIQYQASLTRIQGLDTVQAYSDFTQQQTNLQAAQKAFTQIAGLSLFNYL